MQLGLFNLRAHIRAITATARNPRLHQPLGQNRITKLFCQLRYYGTPVDNNVDKGKL